jgi:hypothetical protein
MKKKSLVLTASTFVVGTVLVGGSAFAANGLLAPQEQEPVSITDVAVPTAETEIEAGVEAAAESTADVEGDVTAGEVAVDADATATAETNGSVRSQEVAVVPREAAKIASEVKGSETGKTISEWAKTQANKKAEAEAEAEVGTELNVDTEVSADLTTEVRGGNR